MKERNLLIDYLKGFGIVVIILTHSLVPYLGDKHTRLLWELIHFAVVAFVFSSAYLYYSRLKVNYFSWSAILKRLQRIVLPYIGYAIVFIVLIFLVEKPFSLSTVMGVILKYGIYDMNWFVILFIYFSFLMPLIQWLYERYRLLWKVYFFLSIAAALIFTYYRPAIDYRYTMWLPWSLFMFLSQLFITSKNKNHWMTRLTIASIIIYGTALITKLQLHQDTSLFNNKYPPGFLYLSYGLMIFGISYHLFNRQFPQRLNSIALFLSSQSYTLFFVHLLVIYVLTTWTVSNILTWPAFFGIVLIISVAIVFLLVKSKYYLRST